SSDNTSLCDSVCPPLCCAHQHPCTTRLYRQPALSLFTPLPSNSATFTAPGSIAVAVGRFQPALACPAELEPLHSHRKSGYYHRDRTAGTGSQMKHMQILVIRPGAIGDVL